jgi:hypothetical protein
LVDLRQLVEFGQANMKLMVSQQNANYYREYFVGPYCASNGKGIYLGIFLDQGCSIPAESGAYESLFYGASLPYSTQSIVDKSCISCTKVDENNNNNKNNNNNNNNNNKNNNNYVSIKCDLRVMFPLLLHFTNIVKNYEYNYNNDEQNAVETSEMCQELYQVSGRCEENLAGSISYPDTTSCDFISNILPKLESASKNVGLYSLKSATSSVPLVCAWVFGVLACTLALYSFLLYRRLKRTKVALNPPTLDGRGDGTMA